jgi:cystathionine beta-lyase
MGIAACKAAYENGEDWMTQMVDYISGNMTLICKFLQEKVPQIKLVEPQGTYLAWLDCKALGYDQKVLEHFMTNKAKLWLSTGTQFGSAGEGFQRVNVACPRSTIQEMLNRLEAAVKTGL